VDVLAILWRKGRLPVLVTIPRMRFKDLLPILRSRLGRADNTSPGLGLGLDARISEC
jgi:hypothetical protein